MAFVKETLAFLAWWLLCLVLCCLYDMVVKYNGERIYPAPHDSSWTPTGFSGFTGRHVLLAVIAILLALMICNDLGTRGPVGLYVLLMLLFAHACVLCRDVFRKIRRFQETTQSGH